MDVPLARSASVLAVRVWPSPEYTRVTLELDQPLKFSQTLIAEPSRLVVDLEGIDVDEALRELIGKVRADDPYIRQVRIGQFKPRVMRLVFDLKADVAPQLFTLTPVAQYRHRLVIDLYPQVPVDPLATLLAAESRRRDASAPPASTAPDPISDLLARGRDADSRGGALPRPEAAAGGARNSSGSAAVASSGGGAGASGNVIAGAAGSPAERATGTSPSLTGTPSGTSAPTAAATGRAPAAASSAAASSAAASSAAASPADGSTTGPAPAGPGGHPLAARGTVRSQETAVRNRAPLVSRMVTIAIDPGHGGEDPGAIGRRGTREKDVVLAVAQRLRDRVNSEPNMRAFLTRDADYFVPLSVRVGKARRVDADLFISIHADAFVRPDARGASVFVLSDHGATSIAARWLAQRENRADLIGGISLGRRDREVARLLLDMSTTSKINDSSRLGRIVLAELGGLGALHKRDIEQAGFAVLKAPDIPSILVETAFISNPQEEMRLANQRHQHDLAEAIFKGIRGYFTRHPVGPKSRST